MSWKNYGDVNPVEHGGIFIKKDGTDFPRCYYVITIYKAPEDDVWILSDMYVDLNDDWYDWDSVYIYASVSEDDSDIDKVIALTQYYGSVEFGHDELIHGEENAIEFVKDLGISVN